MREKRYATNLRVGRTQKTTCKNKTMDSYKIIKKKEQAPRIHESNMPSKRTSKLRKFNDP